MWNLRNKFAPTLLACMLATGTAQAQAQAQTPVAEGPQVGNPANQANSVTQAAVQKGIFKCAVRINQVTSFLGFSDNAGAFLMSTPNQANNSIIPIVMEVPINADRSAFLTTTFAPNQANGCGATYDAVVYWVDACKVVAEKRFPTLKEANVLRKNITAYEGGAGEKLFLMQAGTGCISIKKELVQ